ncbi:(deoxy)nucleoside triphosphate pyrophosphohydrolase [Croceicoccus sp. Ery15]|uniref:(deoxy)nucleoside triphosphate pyrophosphohydrolase n=1 Tax=Croceicoccus sp. Ery15 TaxID=1703338 RepID=UPI00351CD9A6
MKNRPTDRGPDGANSVIRPPMLVVAGALIDDANRVLMHRRPAGKHLEGLWEFPGGKVEAGETPPAALARELAEELGVTISDSAFSPRGFAYETRDFSPPEPARGIVLLLYSCRIWAGNPAPLEGGGLGWFAIPDVDSLDLAPLDRILLGQLWSGV